MDKLLRYRLCLRLSQIAPVVVAVACSAAQKDADTTEARHASQRQHVMDDHGAIIRGNLTEKKIALVLTGDMFADGGVTIKQTLQKHKVKASFFFTGNFYSNPAFELLITDLRDDGHYLGAHSDEHLLYADWTKRDSLLITREEFKTDLRANYKKMASFGIARKHAPWFLPPYEWYNATIARWTRGLGLSLVNFSPGTRSAADYTHPGMGDRYVPSDAIYQSILDREQADPHGLNGFLLLVHIGADPRRTDKFYYKLDKLLTELKGRGYTFVTIAQLLEN